MDKLALYGLLLMSMGLTWFAIWNHYSVLLGAKGIKPTKWSKGDDRTFLIVSGIMFAVFTVIYFTM